MRRRPALTITDLIIILVIVAVLIPALAAAIHNSREVANRLKCGSNLREIATAIQLYGNGNKGKFPRTCYTPGSLPVWGTGINAFNPFSNANRPQDNDITAAYFLLLRSQQLNPELFICPVQNPSLHPIADNFGGARNPDNRSNFSDFRKNLSYSFANPYPDKAAMALGYHLDATTGSEFAIAADLNPGTRNNYDVTFPTEKSSPADMQRANSQNHSWQGQVVLYGDGHAEFQPNPFCGQKRDNIYTVSGSNDGTITTSKTIISSPRWSGDSVLLPVSETDSDPFRPETSSWYWMSGIAGAVVIVLLLGVWVTLRKKAARVRA